MSELNAEAVPQDLADLRPCKKMTSKERDQAHKAERAEIEGAAERMLAGHPTHVPIGELTVVALAKEARVSRAALTHRHTDLRADFEDRREVLRQLVVLPGEAELRESLAQCEADLEESRQDARRLKAQMGDWIRIAHLHLNERDQLATELEHARGRLKRAKVFDLH